MKYFLLGVFASAVMLYGMSLFYGVAGTTRLTGMADAVAKSGNVPIISLAVVFIIVGFAFKVSAVPFHTWAPDTYEGAPTPVTAFLSVASKAAGFVALLTLVYVGFPSAKDVCQPLFWVLSALTMTVGNVLALRQTNIVRMLAYSSISQGGFILMPLAVAGDPAARADSLRAVDHLPHRLRGDEPRRLRRRDRRGPQDPLGRDLQLRRPVQLRARPGRGHDDLPGLAGRRPAARRLDRQVRRVHAPSSRRARRLGVVLAVIGAVNSVIAFGYYGRVMREMWMSDAPDGDVTPIRVPQPLTAGARASPSVTTIVIGVLPQVVLRYGDLGILRRRPRAVIPGLVERIRAGGPDPVRGLHGGRAVRPRRRLLRDRRSGRRAVGATSSPRPRSARSSAPCWPAPSTRGGRTLGRPRPFVVVDAGAGPGTLARAVLAARPAVAVDGALRYVAVERAGGPAGGRTPAWPSRPPRRCPTSRSTGVVVANELLDNLPFRLAGPRRRWREAFVDVDAGGRPVEVLVPVRRGPGLPAGRGGARGPGTRAGRGRRAGSATCSPASGRPGGSWCIDYTSSTADDGGAAVAGVAADLPRPPAGRALPRRSRDAGHHQRRRPRPARRRPTTTSTQAEFLRAHGLEELVDEGRRTWAAHAAAPDLAALTARSRVREAEALTDPAGLGGFTVPSG